MVKEEIKEYLISDCDSFIDSKSKRTRMPIVKECFLHMIGKMHPQNNNDSLNKAYVTRQWG